MPPTSPIRRRWERRLTTSAARNRRCAASSMRRRPSGTGWPPELDDSGPPPASCEPKLGGAIALDRLTHDDPIELFLLLFSSATTLLGSARDRGRMSRPISLSKPWRGSAGRRSRAALAVARGPIEDTGYLAEGGPKRATRWPAGLARKPMSSAQALAALPVIVDSGVAGAAFAETSWNEARRASSPFLPRRCSPRSAPMPARHRATIRWSSGSPGSMRRRLWCC